MELIFTGPARALSAGDVSIVAGYLGCEIAAVRAVLKVESCGRGFAGDGKPIILNEPHVFYRQLGAGAKRKRAVREGLAYRKRGSKPYPRTQAARYKWLAQAIAIDPVAALKSCSWGLGQVMGFNHEIAGYLTVQAFVKAMTQSEGAQLYAVARFCVSKGLQKHLRSHNWARFARGYNGTGYAKGGYHTKLARAYARRPRSERVTPPPATAAQLSALAGTSIASAGAGALARSRTIGGAGAATAGGVAVVIDQVRDVAEEANSYLGWHLLLVVVGVLIVAGGAFALYARWDDAGRPRIRDVFRDVLARWFGPKILKGGV